jgi:hypothetical protein
MQRCYALLLDSELLKRRPWDVDEPEGDHADAHDDCTAVAVLDI